MSQFITYIVLLSLPLGFMACDVPLSISASEVNFQGSTSAPITADILLDEDDANNLDIVGQLFLSYKGPCSNTLLQDLQFGGLEANISSLDEPIQVLPSDLQSVVRPTGVLGFLADLFIDDIIVDISDVTFSVQSDPFIILPDGIVNTEVTIQVLSGSGVAESSLLPGGEQTAELTGTSVVTQFEGEITQDENDLLVLSIPDFQIVFEIEVSGIGADIQLDGNLLAREVV